MELAVYQGFDLRTWVVLVRRVEGKAGF